MSTVDDLLLGDDSSSSGEDVAPTLSDGESTGDETVADVQHDESTDEQQVDQHASTPDEQEPQVDQHTSTPDKQPQVDNSTGKSVSTGLEKISMTQRDWHRKFAKQNPLYKRCKLRYVDYCYIKPRTAIPATGKPVLYVAEGAENWTGAPNLLCAGQLLFCDKKQWVVIVVLWVGCLTRTRPDGTNQYSPFAKKMKVLLCPHKTFDNADKDLDAVEGELRYVLFFFMYYNLIFNTYSGYHFALIVQTRLCVGLVVI